MATLKDLTAGNWTIDATHSQVGFTARHMMVSKVRGKFTEFDADIKVGEDLESSSVSATIQMASVDTNNEQRDGHLRTNDFFEVETYPTMTFTSTKITESTIEGDLTIKDVTKSVVFDYEYGGAIADDGYGNPRAGFEASTEINRKDFNVKFNAPIEGGGAVVSDKITINLDIELVKAA